MTVSIRITRADNNRLLKSFYSDSMTLALLVAFREGRKLAKQHGDLYLRDCLGGLRAEVRIRDGEITIKKTA